MTITMLIYAIVRGHPSKMKMTHASVCTGKLRMNSNLYTLSDIYSHFYVKNDAAGTANAEKLCIYP